MYNKKDREDKEFPFQKEFGKNPVNKQICSSHSYRKKIEILYELYFIDYSTTIGECIKEIPDKPEKNVPPDPVPE